jgi:hypothetical protein
MGLFEIDGAKVMVVKPCLRVFSTLAKSVIAISWATPELYHAAPS